MSRKKLSIYILHIAISRKWDSFREEFRFFFVNNIWNYNFWLLRIQEEKKCVLKYFDPTDYLFMVPYVSLYDGTHYSIIGTCFYNLKMMGIFGLYIMDYIYGTLYCKIQQCGQFTYETESRRQVYRQNNGIKHSNGSAGKFLEKYAIMFCKYIGIP